MFPGFLVVGHPGDEGDSPGIPGEGDGACDSYGVERVSAYHLKFNFSHKMARTIRYGELSKQGNFEKVYFHPLVNTASTGISLSDFRKFLSITGHEIVTV